MSNRIFINADTQGVIKLWFAGPMTVTVSGANEPESAALAPGLREIQFLEQVHRINIRARRQS
ncbi:MAG TPA: hypothetical protein VNJ09_03990 [Chthonomonadales bacterium]|nr:hypothetical protein [Chthonomonadales bacterium]